MDAWIPTLLHWLSLPEFGLSTVFVIALVSATLLPMGSEPAVVGLLQLRPDLFWPTVCVATAGNTLGGAISWWLGRGAQRAWHAARKQRNSHPDQPRAARELTRHERRARIWLRLPFWPCVGYMAIGKFLRYVVMTSVILWAIERAA